MSENDFQDGVRKGDRALPSSPGRLALGTQLPWREEAQATQRPRADVLANGAGCGPG